MRMRTRVTITANGNAIPQAMWDYRIKVDPWQVFGTVELEITGTDIVVEHVWAA